MSNDTRKVFRMLGGGRVDHDAIQRTATQASNQKGRPASWPQASKDRPGITTSDSLTAPAPDPNILRDRIRQFQQTGIAEKVEGGL